MMEIKCFTVYRHILSLSSNKGAHLTIYIMQLSVNFQKQTIHVFAVIHYKL